SGGTRAMSGRCADVSWEGACEHWAGNDAIILSEVPRWLHPLPNDASAFRIRSVVVYRIRHVPAPPARLADRPVPRAARGRAADAAGAAHRRHVPHHGGDGPYAAGAADGTDAPR